MPATTTPQYPFSVTFHGKDIVEVRQGMVNFLADNVTSTAGVPEVVSTPAESPGKKPRKTAKKAKSKIPLGTPGPEETAPSVSADTDKAPELDSPVPGDPDVTKSSDITPDEHPNVSLAYNNALEQLMAIYNASPEGAYEVTLLLEHYRVVSFREIPEDRGVELLDKAEAINSALAGKQKSA